MKRSGIVLLFLLMAGLISLSGYAQDSKEHKHNCGSDSSGFSMQGITIKKIGKDSMIVYVRTGYYDKEDRKGFDDSLCQDKRNEKVE